MTHNLMLYYHKKRHILCTREIEIKYNHTNKTFCFGYNIN